MKRILMLLMILAFCTPLYAVNAVYNTDRSYDIVGWHVVAADDDCSTGGATLVTDEDTAYTQMSDAQKIEVLSSDNADKTQTVTIFGIDSSGDKISESISLNGTTVVSGATTFTYFDYAEIDIECAGNVTIQKLDDTDITIIPIGILNSQILQHFNGEMKSYITYWAVTCMSTTANLTATLRYYPSTADALDSSDGFITLDTIYINAAATSPYNVIHEYAQPIKIPANSWLGVFVDGSADNGSVAVILQGYDSSR